MAISAAEEQRMAERRARRRQLTDPPLLIRDDGRLYPNTKLMQRHPRYRPYHGDPKASLDDRMRYLSGLGKKRAVTFEETDEPFDINAADVDELVQFALEQYGAILDPMKPRKTLQKEVFRLSQIDAGVTPAPVQHAQPSALPRPSQAFADDDGGEEVVLGAIPEGDAPTTTEPAAPRRNKPGPKPGTRRSTQELATGLAAAGG